MSLYYRDNIYHKLNIVNKRFSKEGLYLDLKIVGGSALIFNDISSVETEDIDTINCIPYEVREILDECSLDINDDAMDYIHDYDHLEFIKDDKRTFSNITIEYLSIGGVIKTKLGAYQDDKAEKLRYLLEDVLNVPLTKDGIILYLKEQDETIDSYTENNIDAFLETIKGE